MRRIKRFVLAENTEKNPRNWKNSDNMLTRFLEKSMMKSSDENVKEENVDESRVGHLSTVRLT